MSTTEPEHQNRDVEEKRAKEDEDIPIVRFENVAVEEENSPDRSMMLRNDVQGESSVMSDHPQFDGFDLPIGGLSYCTHRVYHYDYESNRPFNPNRVLAKRYAQLGLHRYNLLEGTNWEFLSLKSFNMGTHCGASPYFLTLCARDPALGKVETFHARVSEACLGRFDLYVDIARPRGLVEPPPLCQRGCELSLALPLWPSSKMITDTHHFYKLDESELQNTEWLFLYLHLAHCTTSRSMTEMQLLDFDIVQVIIQSPHNAEPPRINSRNLVIYIVYKSRRGKPSEGRAIIRRLFNESTRSLEFKGKHWCPSEKKKKKRYALLNKRLGVYGAWRLRKRGFFSR